MLSTLTSILFVLLLAIAAAGAGTRLGRRTGLLPSSMPASERLLFGSALGYGLLALMALGLGLAGGLYRGPLVALPCVLALLGGRETLAAIATAWRMGGAPWRTALALARDRNRSVYGAWLLICLALAAIYTLAILAAALAPPAGADYDALAYHLNVPALYLRWHAIRYDPYILHSNFPQVTEMLYLYGLAAGIRGVKAIHMVVGLLAAGGCWSLARGYGRAAALVALLAFWTTPVVGWEATAGYTDLAFALFECLAFLAAVRFSNESRPTDLALAGVCQGLALSVKYTALAFVPLLAILIVALSWRRNRRWKDALAALAVAAGWALLLALPWYLRTFLWTGNPVFPYYYSIFGGRNWSHEAETAYRLLQLGYGTGHGVVDFLASPLHLLTLPALYFEPGGSREFGSLMGALSPVFLVSAGLLSFIGRWRARAAALGALFTLFYVEWYVLMQQVRYLVEAIPLLAPACGLALALDRVPRLALPGTEGRRAGVPDRWARLAGVVVLGVWIAWVTFVFVEAFGYPFAEVASFSPGAPTAAEIDLGLVDRDDYLSSQLPDLWPVASWVSSHLPADARLATLGEPRDFYFDRYSLWADGYEQEKLRYASITDGRALADALREQKIGWVLIRLGGPLGLLGQYGVAGAAQHPAEWTAVDRHKPGARWLLLYRDALARDELVQVYPAPPTPTDKSGYAVYQVRPVPTVSSHP